jgi:hypothetical protein
MPHYTSITHRPDYDVLRDNHYSTLKSRMLDSSYIAADQYGIKTVYAGMIVAVDSSTSKYVPYSAGASYGTGSDTAVGVLKERYNVTWTDVPVAPFWHGTAIEEFCFVYGGALGTVPSAVKTALDDIEWT